MQAALLYSKEDIRLESFDLPPLQGHDLLLRIRSCGICGSDTRMFFNGPTIPCMHCKPCSSGQDNICETAKVIGCNVHGGMAEYIHVPSQMVQVGGVVKIQTGIHPREAALAELVGCCLHGLSQVGLEAGQQVLIIGGGPIGMTFVQLAKLMGARVVSSELLERRRQLALELGADEVVDPLTT